MADQCSGDIPFEFDETEPEVVIEFDAQPFEPTTRDYPGSDASIDITRVVRVDDGSMVSLSAPGRGLIQQLEQQVWNYLEKQGECWREH